MIANLIRKTKALYRAFSAIFFLTKNNVTKNKPKKLVFLDLTKGRFWQSYFFILFSYLKDGYTVYIIINFKCLGGLSNHSRELLRHPNLCGSIFYPKKKSCVFLTDKDNPKKSIFTKINHNYFDRPNEAISLPFMMHPTQYLSGNYLKVETLRGRAKKIKILFAGNTERAAYNNKHLANRFGVMTRFEAVTLILESIEKKSLLLASSQSPVESILLDDSAKSKIVIASWEWSPKASVNLEAKIEPENWLPTLSSSAFFLALPGIIMPFSHNAVEAMSVGCIPILEYGDMFDPPLEDGVNSIHFNRSTLIKSINAALSMDDSRINEISKNAAKYYDKYLRPESLVRSISKANTKGVEIYCIDEVNEACVNNESGAGSHI